MANYDFVTEDAFWRPPTGCLQPGANDTTTFSADQRIAQCWNWFNDESCFARVLVNLQAAQEQGKLTVSPGKEKEGKIREDTFYCSVSCPCSHQRWPWAHSLWGCSCCSASEGRLWGLFVQSSVSLSLSWTRRPSWYHRLITPKPYYK